MKKQFNAMIWGSWHARFASLLCASLIMSGAAHASTFTVDRTDDAAISTCDVSANDCTLRGAVTKANATAGTDTILFDTTVFATAKTITLNTAFEILSDTVTITGPGASKLTVKTASNTIFSVFTIGPAVSATISGLTLSNATDGLYSGTGSTLTVTNCTISGNITGISNQGGTATLTGCTLSNNSSYGIVNSGTLTATNCTFTANSSVAIYNNNGGTLNITSCTVDGSSNGTGSNGTGINTDAGTLTATNCTVSGNNIGLGTSGGGVLNITACTVSNNNFGIYNSDGTTTIKNTLDAGNTNNTLGTLTDGGYNITSGSAAAAGLQTDAGGIALLADNGGPTQTIALVAGSPAIDKGLSFGLTTDQRGFNRPFNDPAIVSAAGGDNSDIGAFELGGLPSVSVNNPRSLNEGSAAAPGSITFDITLNAASTQSATVNYQTTVGKTNPATAGTDYTTKAGKLTFAPGETLKRVTIFFIGDSLVELNETFYVDLLTPTNAILGDSRGVGTIVNDDGPGITIEDAVTIDEGNSGTTGQKFIVRLSAASANTVTVDWTTADNTAGLDDYVAASGTLTFTPGQTSKIITILVNGDSLFEPNETYKVNLSKPTYAFLTDAQGIGTIRNDDTPPPPPLILQNDEPSR